MCYTSNYGVFVKAYWCVCVRDNKSKLNIKYINKENNYGGETIFIQFVRATGTCRKALLYNNIKQS